MSRTTSWGGVAMLLALVAGCDAGRESKGNAGTRVEILVRDSLRDPIAGAEVRWGRESAVSDEEGRAVLSLTPKETRLLEGRCPPGHAGAPLQKSLSQAVVDSGAQLKFLLHCEPIAEELGVAVLSEGCGEVRVAIDGRRLGTTRGGVLHRLVPVPEKNFVELSAEPLDSNCELEDAARLIEVDPLAPAVWAVFSGRMSRAGKGRALRKTRSLPYRL